MTIYADAMGFLFSQQEMIERPTDMRIDPNIRLDLCHVTAAPPTLRTIDEIEAACRSTVELLEEQGIVAIRSRKDILKNNLKAILGLQHPPLDATLADLHHIKKMGVLFCTIAYEEQNIFGGGFATPNVRLSEMGKEFIFNLAEARMVLDLSHVGHQTARDILATIHQECVSLPVVATHTGAFEVYSHPRNLPDDILQGIKYLRGFVGVTTCIFMNHESDNSLNPFLAHVRHMVHLIGNLFVGIGSDGVYKKLDANTDRERFELMKDLIDPRGNFRTRYPDQPFALNCPDRMARLDVELREQWTTTIAERLLGRNFFNFVAAHV